MVAVADLIDGVPETGEGHELLRLVSGLVR